MTVVCAVRMHLLVHLKAKEREREKGGDKEGKRGGVREGERMREDESELAALQLSTAHHKRYASNCGRTIGVVSEPLQHRWRILHNRVRPRPRICQSAGRVSAYVCSMQDT